VQCVELDEEDADKMMLKRKRAKNETWVPEKS